jgi:homoserine kinase
MTASTVSVVVPATTANLGSAFDCAGIALSLHLRVSATAGSEAAPGGAKNPCGPLTVGYRGPNAAEIPLDDRNLIVKSMQHYAARAGKRLPGASIAIENEIPLGVGRRRPKRCGSPWNSNRTRTIWPRRSTAAWWFPA